MQELADRIWANKAFHRASRKLHRNWLARDIGLPPNTLLPLKDVTRLVEASAALALSSNAAHRIAAYRAATEAYELHGESQLPFAPALRVVLGRLGNFPAMHTRSAVAESREHLPLSLVAEELDLADRRTISLPEGEMLLTEFQHGLWSRLDAGESAAVAAPTSAGKSFVLQAFLRKLFQTPGPCIAVYLVPTRALITQVSHDLRPAYAGRDVQIATVPIEAGAMLPERAVFVMTQERVQALLNAHPRLVPATVVVDEAHGIAEGSRGVLLQGVLERLIGRNPDVQVLFASPGVRNLDVFGRTLALPNVVPLRSTEPTVGQNFLIARVVDPEEGLTTVRAIGMHNNPLGLGEVLIGRRCVTRVEKLANLTHALGRGAVNVVYANGAAEAEDVAVRLATLLRGRDRTAPREALARMAVDAVHPDYVLTQCVLEGVAFHYSNMPAQLRLAIEQAVVEGHVDHLVCTSTMLQGVNLPAKNIFMYRPEKGQNTPLDSVDFWNLAGRAGRLLREFHGNVILVDYDDWSRKPLASAREADVVPAFESGVARQTAKLLEIVTRSGNRTKSDANLEAVFVKMLGQHRAGSLRDALEALSRQHDLDTTTVGALTAAMNRAAGAITLPQAVLRRSPDISPHRQQILYEVLARRIRHTPNRLGGLILRHPHEEGAYESYSEALRLCHRVILGMKPESRFHRFLALVALWWMKGRPLPRIVQNQINRNPDGDRRRVIRDTLEFVEREVRFQCVRLLGCYQAILTQALVGHGAAELAAGMPEIPLFLEVGASTRTAMSLISLGVGRPYAIRLAAAAPSTLLDIAATKAWLSSDPAALARLPAGARAEVDSALARLVLR
ncbi:DEAD/DEAH box helicase [uncultured Sphingomonas sp.]|uniref:DEAD/DEAH box helicase n=1 Tax=uncultured Sphingomonas sp. TaxID=158754 RepID=UPI0025D6A255|nr:DEAD/DEAH box helicase [uncultured Sphingomonas sp.]